jgi:hypothetical protein
MGYTHYNYRPRKNAGSAYMYGKLALDAKAICEHAQSIGIKLGDWSGENGTSPQFTEGEFSFNGIDDMSHETFTWKALPTQVEWRKDEPEIFDFCKTAMKPYDAVVTAILIRAKEIYGSCVSISSDGNWSEWQDGRELYEAVFGEIAECPFDGASV